MKTLAILSRKGGPGKTTLSINLAVAAEKAGHTTILIDLDEQGSADRWGKRRSEETNEDTPFVTASSATRLKEVLYHAENAGATLAIIDTAPSTGPDPEQNPEDAAKAADMVLIPCETSLINAEAIISTINVVHKANVDARVVFNKVDPRTGSDRVKQAHEAVKKSDVSSAPCHVSQRVAFVDSYALGLSVQEYEPRGKASKEIKDLYKYISAEMGV